MIPILAWKIGGPIAGAALMFGALHLYNESLRSEGKAECEQEHAEDREAQHEEVLKAERLQHQESLAAVEKAKANIEWVNEQILKKSRAQEATTHKLKGQLDALLSSQPDTEVRYVEVEKHITVPVQQPCFLPDHVTVGVDQLTSLLNTLTHRHLSDTGRALDELDVQSTGPVTCAQLAKWAELVTSRYAKSMIDHKALSDYITKQVNIHREFQRGQIDELARSTRPND